MLLRRGSLVVLFVSLSVVSPLSGRQARPVSNAPPGPIRLTAEDAARLAKETRAKVKVEVPPGLELSLWASERLVNDPIAIDVDPKGTVYVTSSSRNNLPLDIRGHQDWMPIVHTLKSVDDLRNFYRRVMAPESSAKNSWSQEHNKDDQRQTSELDP